MAIQTRLEDMVIGDKIICMYVGGSNHFGHPTTGNSFSQLGVSKNDLIPANGVRSGSGTFYFIYVGKDFKGRMILVADRNIQNSISWDTLNAAGVATKDGVELNIPHGIDMTNWKTNIRLLTGGTSISNTANSEWDKYIVNGPIGGDNAIWNWSGLYSWTSTTFNTGPALRTLRGNVSASTLTGNSTVDGVSFFGFRPVLVAESLSQPIQNKYLIQDDNDIKTFQDNEWLSLGPAPASKEMFDTHGEDISVLNDFARREHEFNSQMNITDSPVENGKVFSGTVDLKKFSDVTTIKIESV